MDAANIILSGVDVAAQRQWRDEDREWRSEDRRWHASEEATQRALDNARYTWSRHVEKNRRDVEERTEQLKVVSQVAALLAGFAVIGLAEFEIEEDVRDREWLITLFGVTTGVIVGLMTLSTVICTYMLAGILRVGKTYVSLLQEERFLFACKAYIEEGQPGELPPTPERTFERHWELRCEPDWQLAFSMFAAGLPLFLANVGLLAWVKFHYSALTAGFITAVAALAVTVWLRMHLKWGALLREPTEALYSSAGSVCAADFERGLPWDWCTDEHSAAREGLGDRSPSSDTGHAGAAWLRMSPRAKHARARRRLDGGEPPHAGASAAAAAAAGATPRPMADAPSTTPLPPRPAPLDVPAPAGGHRP
eukprot:PRCOL_00004162-RA